MYRDASKTNYKHWTCVVIVHVQFANVKSLFEWAILLYADPELRCFARNLTTISVPSNVWHLYYLYVVDRLDSIVLFIFVHFVNNV